MTLRDEIKKQAEEISLNCPGNWPDDKSQKIRREYFEQALLERHNKSMEMAEKHFQDNQCSSSECDCQGTVDFDALKEKP